jgi:hypothetical protein
MPILWNQQASYKLYGRKFILTEQAREEFQCDGACGAEHTSQSQCIQTNHVMDSAGTAELEYPMLHAESLDPISSRIQQGLRRHTATIMVITTRLRGTLKLNRYLEGIFQLTHSTRWSCPRGMKIPVLRE